MTETASLVFAEDLSLPLDTITQKLAFLGQSGSGKSYAAMRLAESIFAAGGQVIALDPVGIWHGLRAAADGDGPGLPILVLGGDHGDLPLAPDLGEIVATTLASGGASAVLDVSQFTTGETKRFVAAFAEGFFQAKKAHKSPVHLFLEEAQTFAPQMPERDEGLMLNRVERLVKLGRNYGVGCSLVSQQPQAVHKRILNQTGILVALRTIGRHERKAIADWVTDKVADEAEVDLLAALPGLDTGHAHVWSPSFLRVSRTVVIARRETFDSSATPGFGEVAITPRQLADVDVTALRAALADSLAAAERDDPAALRARIADLESQARDLGRKLLDRPASAPVVREVPTVVEVPVLKERDLARVEELLAQIAPLTGPLGDLLTRLIETVGAVGARVELARLDTAEPPAAPPPTNDARALAPPSPVRAPEHLPARPLGAEPSPVAIVATGGEAGGLKPGARRILEALARCHPLRLTRAQVGMLSDLTHTGGSFMGHLGALKRRGALTEDGGDLGITPCGFATLGVAPPPRPPGGAELRAMYRAALPNDTQRRILDALIAAHPGRVSPEALAEAVGMTATGGAFQGHIGLLRRNDLAEKVGGSLVAGAALFPDR